MRARLVPSKYFMTAGTGESDASALNAFDRALVEAGISQCNLVPVSSILPKTAKETEPVKIKPGEITFVVMGKSVGRLGDHISAGVAIGRVKVGESHMIVESSQDCSLEELRGELQNQLSEMANARGWQLEDIIDETCEIEVKKSYGAAVAAVVLLL